MGRGQLRRRRTAVYRGWNRSESEEIVARYCSAAVEKGDGPEKKDNGPVEEEGYIYFCHSCFLLSDPVPSMDSEQRLVEIPIYESTKECMEHIMETKECFDLGPKSIAVIKERTKSNSVTMCLKRKPVDGNEWEMIPLISPQDG